VSWIHSEVDGNDFGVVNLVCGYVFSKVSALAGGMIGKLFKMGAGGGGGMVADDAAISIEQAASASLSKAAQLAANKEAGLAHERVVLQWLRDQGLNAKMFKTAIFCEGEGLAAGRRFPDIAIYDDDRIIMFIEVKSGSATRNAAQVAKDTWIAKNGGPPTSVINGLTW